MTQIHATALVDPGAELDSSVTVGPYTLIGPHVKVGAGTTIGAHCVVEGRTTIGQNNRIFQFNSIGAIPQDKKYAGEPTELIIGDRNNIREFCTFNLMSTQWSSLGEPFDLVFCRNVMIYFDAATQRQVLQRIHAQLKPGGLLYVGHSENFSDSSDLFRLRGKTIYERV